MKIDVVSTTREPLGESCYWDVNSQTLYWASIKSKQVKRLFPTTGQVSAASTEEEVSTVVLRSNGKGLLIPQGNRLDFFDFDSCKQTPFVSKESLGLATGESTNDGKCDPKGRFWVGTLTAAPGKDFFDWPHNGGLYVVTPDGKVQKKLSNIGVGNGMDWTTDERSFVYADSLKGTVSVYDYDVGTANISKPRVAVKWSDLKSGFPDGLTLDANNKLWVAVFMSASVVQYDLETGKELQKVDLSPTTNLTCANFGGPNLDQLFVTSAQIFLSPEQLAAQSNAGSLFRVSGLNVKGKAPFSFAG